MNLNCLPERETLASMHAEYRFVRYEVCPVATNADEDGNTDCEVTTSDRADFWTIYGMCEDGDSLPLHDVYDKTEVVSWLIRMRQIVPLPVTYYDPDTPRNGVLELLVKTVEMRRAKNYPDAG